MGDSVFTEAACLLEGRFTTSPANRDAGKGVPDNLTAHAAVMSVFGVDRDSHAIAYNGSDWPILADQMAAAFGVLNEIASEHAGRDISFMVWSSKPERTYEEVVGVFAEADRRAPQVIVTEPAQPRPSTPQMPGVQGHRWIICNVLGTIAEGRQTELSDVIRDVLPDGDRTERDVIARLDEIIDDEGLPRDAARKNRLNVELARAWGSTKLADLWFDKQLVAGAVGSVKPRVLVFDEFLDIIGSRSFWESCDDTELELALEPFTPAPGKSVK